jgi:hypothetical protein
MESIETVIPTIKYKTTYDVMKKVLLYNFLLTLALYAIYYVCRTFVIWKFENPFQWIIDIPTYDYEGRLLILTCYLMYQGIQMFTIYQNLYRKDEPKIPSNL